MSPWEARIAIDTIHEVYFRDPTCAPLKSGQLRFDCLRTTEGADKPLADCRPLSVVLTVLAADDPMTPDSAVGLRRHKLACLAEQARELGGLLTQEDLAQLLGCDVRTVRRDIQYLKKHQGAIVPTRGPQKDIGPTVTHKKEILEKLIFEGKSVTRRTVPRRCCATRRISNKCCCVGARDCRRPRLPLRRS